VGAILDKVQQDVVKVINEPEFVERFLKPQSVEGDGRPRQEFAAFLKRELAVWGEMARSLGAKAE
jgi:tripartite-type tricarboxylate transporter receptor subunit TctC